VEKRNLHKSQVKADILSLGGKTKSMGDTDKAMWPEKCTDPFFLGYCKCLIIFGTRNSGQGVFFLGVN